MAYTRNPPWKDYPDTSTPITAAKLERIEGGVEAAASTADAAQSGLSGKASLAHVHPAGDVTSGVFDIARIPTGTTNTTVAIGDHTHAASGGAGKNWLSGVWSLPGVNVTAAISNESTSANTLYMVPFYVSSATTLTDLAINVGTAAAAGNSARLGVYSKDATGTGWTLVTDAGTTLIDTTGDKILSGLTISLASAGVYGVAVLPQAACSLNSRGSGMALQGPQTNPFATSVSVYMSVAQAYGVLPATAAPTPQGGFTSAFHRAMVKLS